MDKLVARVHANPKAEGVSEIMMPGEIESRLEAERRRTGVPYGPKEFAALQAEAEARRAAGAAHHRQGTG